MSDAMRVLREAVAELDEIQTGKVAKAALAELLRQVSHDRAATLAADFVAAAIENWNPPGPKLTDRAIKRAACKHTKQAVYATVKELLMELEP